MNTTELLSIGDAQKKILKDIKTCFTERLHLRNCYGRVLAEDLKAPFSIPPHNNSAMDGYAFMFNDIEYKKNPITLAVTGEVAAGHIFNNLIESGEAVRIMTGAVIPDGCDTVIPFELTSEKNGKLTINKKVDKGMNIRYKGEDVQADDSILAKGQVLRPQDIGMAASFGYDYIKIFKKPRVGILATGDEIISVGTRREKGQVFDTNSYTLAGQIEEMGGEPVILGIASDSKEEIKKLIKQGLNKKVDIIISSGGISTGNFDYVRDVLEDYESILFHQVKMRPGKPFSCGNIEGTYFFGLPGNPVASMISTEILIKPIINKMRGSKTAGPFFISALMDHDIKMRKGLTYIYRVNLNKDGLIYKASLSGPQGSGILNTMVKADGLAVVSEDIDFIKKGDFVNVIPFSTIYRT